MKKRIISAAVLLLIALFVNAMLAGLLALISTGDYSFIDGFCRIFILCFGLFGGWSFVAAFLLIATNFPDNYANNYSMGFYYGSFGCFWVLTELLDMEINGITFFLSCCFSGLLCYIFWLKNKPSDS